MFWSRMWLLIQHQPSAESKYARELCRPREPGNQRTLHHSFPRPLTPSPRHRTARSGRGGRHPRAPLVWSFALQGEGRRPVSGSRLAPTPAAALAPRRAEREKQPLLPHHSPPLGWLCARLLPLAFAPPPTSRHTLSLGSAPPETDADARQPSPPSSPPSGAFRAFRYYSARPS